MKPFVLVRPLLSLATACVLQAGAIVVLAQPAAELVLEDTFTVSADSADVNFEITQGRQGGSAAGTAYVENVGGANGGLTRLEGGRLLLEATAGVNYTAITPAHHFNEGGRFNIEFDLDAGINDAANASGDWACIVFGASAAVPVFVNGSDGMGILFRNSGAIQVFDGGTAVYAGGTLPLGSLHVRIEVESPGFGLGGPATIRMWVDGAPVQIGAGTIEHVKAAGFQGNYLTLGASAFGGANWIHAFDNLRVSATPCIRPSVNVLNSSPGQASQTVNVSIPSALNQAGPVEVTVTSSHPDVAVPAGAVNGSVTLTFPPGTTTRSYTVVARENGTTTFSLSTTAESCVEGATVVTVGATFVRNPSFEENYNPSFPGYSPVNQWTAFTGGNSGVNEATGPFHDNSTIPDRSRVALFQGSGGLRQTISGLQSGREYWLQFRYNKRQGGLMGLRTVFAGVTIDNIPSIAVAGAAPYHFRQVAFTPAGDSGDLEFRTSATGDATVLLDAVTIVPRGAGQVLVQNPSFEASGFVPGEVISPGPISGWAGTGTYGVAKSLALGSRADNGTNPDQEGVAFIAGLGSVGQVISNLVVGQTYEIRYSINAGAGGFPALRLTMGDTELRSEFETLEAVGGKAPYLRVTNQWQATAPRAELKFETFDDFTGSVALIDDVQIVGLSLPPCVTTVSVEKFELVSNLPVGPATVDVGIPLYLVATSTVNVVVISLNPNVAIPTGAALDRITLTFPQGNTTNLSFGITGVGPGLATFIVSNTLDCASTSFQVRNRASYVLNPSFEDNSLPAFPGYGPVADWTGGSGVNTASQPFADNGGIPDRGQVVFIQGPGVLSQEIGGLQIGRSYWVQFGYNTRNCCTPPEQAPLHLAVHFGGVELGVISNIVAGSYRPATFRFVSAASSGRLEFVSILPLAGDRTALLDAVNIVARDADDALVLNASFEGTGAVPFPGTVAPAAIGGWAGGGGYGVNISGAGPFADNGRNPDQDNVAYLQGENSFLGTVVGPIEWGATYRLSYAYNARGGNTPRLRMTVNDVTVSENDVTPVGGVAPYRTAEHSFVAGQDSISLVFTQTAPGDQTVLLDDVRVVRTAPGGVRLHISQFDGGTVRVAWSKLVTGYLLESALRLPAAPTDWAEPGLPIVEEGDESVVYDTIDATRFYRLRRP